MKPLFMDLKGKFEYNKIQKQELSFNLLSEMFQVPEFWCPTKIKVNGLLYEFEPLIENKSVKYHYQNAAGFSYIAEDTRRCIEQKKIESEHMTFKDSLQLLSTTETLRRMVGNLFPEDHASTQTQTERRK